MVGQPKRARTCLIGKPPSRSFFSPTEAILTSMAFNHVQHSRSVPKQKHNLKAPQQFSSPVLKHFSLVRTAFKMKQINSTFFWTTTTFFLPKAFKDDNARVRCSSRSDQLWCPKRSRKWGVAGGDLGDWAEKGYIQ